MSTFPKILDFCCKICSLRPSTGLFPQRTLWLRRKSTSGTNSFNDLDMTKWRAAVINTVSYTCAFPVGTCQNAMKLPIINFLTTLFPVQIYQDIFQPDISMLSSCVDPVTPTSNDNKIHWEPFSALNLRPVLTFVFPHLTLHHLFTPETFILAISTSK